MGSRGDSFSAKELALMRRALDLARRGYGATSPNPMVGAVLVRDGEVIGEGWHRRAGERHAEVHAIDAALRRGKPVRGATLFVTLEPCRTYGRTPPCTEAIIRAGITTVIAATSDPNPRHRGRGLSAMRKAGIMVRTGALAAESDRLNEAFNHWIVHRKPWVLCKCAMSLDGKIATNSGESKWISSEKARHFGMQLRLGADAIVAGVNTILRDDPALTLRPRARLKIPPWKRLRRIILDPEGRTPESARILSDEDAALTTLVVTERASPGKIAKLEKRVQVFVARTVGADRRIDLRSLLRMLGSEGVVSILVEGGGETHFNFLRHSLVNRIHFFFAPLLITGRSAPKSVAGNRTLRRGKGVKLSEVEYTKIGPDLLCSGTVNC